MIRTLAIAIISSSILGCAGYQSPATKLAASAHRYNESVRWRNYDTAAKYVESKERKKYLETRRSLTGDMKILDYEVGEIRQIKPNKEAEVRVRFTWHELPSFVVQHTTFKQQWLYGKNKKWVFAGQEEIEDKPIKKSPTLDKRF